MDLSKHNIAELSSLLDRLNKKLGAADDSHALACEVERHVNAIQDSLKQIVKKPRGPIAR